jgi:hypothetical protein
MSAATGNTEPEQALARLAHTVRSEAKREAREFKARAGSSPEAYLTVRRGLDPSATLKARASREPQPEECEKCGLEPILFT